MNTDLRKRPKTAFEKDFFKLMNNAVFRKTIKNVRKHRVLNLSQQKEEQTVWWQNQIIYYKAFHRKFISNRHFKKVGMFMNKTVYLGLSILELSKILNYEFWYHYVKSKYGEKA